MIIKFWLIVYPDGTFMTWRANKPDSRNHQEGARCYAVEPDTTLLQISDWCAYNFPEVRWAHELRTW